MKYHVDLKPDTVPVYESSGRKSKEENDHLKAVNDRWLEAEIISHSNSSWGARVVIAKKKDGTPRECVNFWSLNQGMILDQYPIPHVDDVLDFLGDGNGYMISELDAKSGFRQLEVDKETRPLLAYKQEMDISNTIACLWEW